MYQSVYLRRTVRRLSPTDCDPFPLGDPSIAFRIRKEKTGKEEHNVSTSVQQVGVTAVPPSAGKVERLPAPKHTMKFPRS